MLNQILSTTTCHPYVIKCEENDTNFDVGTAFHLTAMPWVPFEQLREQAIQKGKEIHATHVFVVWQILDFMRVDIYNPRFVFCYRAEDLDDLIQANSWAGVTLVGEIIPLE